MEEASIPKVIHYCWFGKGPKSPLITRCIESWRTTNPSFTIKEWNEENYDVYAHPFTKKMYTSKKWAFVADYARLEILEKEGGFYLDTDMLLLQSLSPLSTNSCILGEEEPGIISAGMIASAPHHPYIQKARKYYDDHTANLVTIPRVLTKIFSELEDKSNVVVYPSHYFYPFDASSIKYYTGQKLADDVYGVHLWNYSWGHPLNKFFKKIGVYSFGKKVTEVLRIKKLIKKILRFV